MKSCHFCACIGIVAYIGLTAPQAFAADWPMFGRDKTRNAVSPEKDPPSDWNIGTFDRKSGQWIKDRARHVKWVARLGSITCGDPVLADGLIWVGTNNSSFDSNQDASVLVCLRESDGKLLYKYVSPRLAGKTWQDWAYSSMACSPLVLGDKLWFTTNRCEAVCLDIGPLKHGTGEPRVLWKCDMITLVGWCIVLMRGRESDTGPTTH